jgi:hypothetical protein
MRTRTRRAGHMCGFSGPQNLPARPTLARPHRSPQPIRARLFEPQASIRFLENANVRTLMQKTGSHSGRSGLDGHRLR